MLSGQSRTSKTLIKQGILNGYDILIHMNEKKRIVILGAGFAGMHTYLGFDRDLREHHEITIIDQHNHFLFTPMLHEAATGVLDLHSIAVPVQNLIQSEDHFHQASVTCVNMENQFVETTDGHFEYDILISALGAQTQFFGTPGAEEHSFPLKTLHDAKVLRNHMIDCFEQASDEQDESKRKQLLHLVIVGGGPTGVEFASEAAGLYYDTLSTLYAGRIDMNEAQLTLVNAGDAVLKMFHEKFQQYAQQTLTKQGVTVLNETRVASVSKDGITTATESKILAKTVVWAAGVSAKPLECVSPIAHERNRIHIDKTLRVPDHDNVFVLGDMSLYPTEEGRGLPMLAQVASQQGKHTAMNIRRLLTGDQLEPFLYQPRGVMASLGSWEAVAEVFGMRFTGFIAHILWKTVYLSLIMSWRKRIAIMSNWFSNLFSKRDIAQIDD